MYRVEISNEGGSQFAAKSKDYEFIIDTKGGGMTPPDALLASLGSCIGVYVRKYAEGAKLDMKALKIIVEAEFGKDQPVCFKNIDVSIWFNGAALDERRKASLLEFIKNCPVHNTLKNNPHVAIALR